ncbi:CPK2 [Symbiodinium natans]|uniref:CPK2 protein n=1 Tax=Symbiodinium natans TaxID=878477 RepID=A0A812I965_9DINO|nr:CPK2 [Symbiodinium natans]
MKRVQNGDHVVRLHETYEDDCFVYMVMELCQGGELVAFLLEQGTHTEAQVVLVMRQVFKAVAFLHSCAICHRDLKPENLLLLHRQPIKDNILKVTDFGLSALCPHGSDLRGMMGTLPYMAPQVISGRYDLAADLWSCGVLTYLLLSGYPPFWHDTDMMKTTAAIKRGNFAFPMQDWSAISQDAKAMVRELLKMNPAERITAKNACQHAWLTTTPAATVLDGSLHRLRRFMKAINVTQVVSEDPLLGKARPQSMMESFFSVVQSSMSAVCSPCSAESCSASFQHQVQYVRPGTLADTQFSVGMRVHYQSITHRAWLPTVVVDVNDAGDVEIEIKPRVWIAPADQVNLLRAQAAGEGGLPVGLQGWGLKTEASKQPSRQGKALVWGFLGMTFTTPRRHAAFRRPHGSRGTLTSPLRSLSESDALRVLGVDLDEVDTQALRRSFRAKAKTAHPDAGGSKEDFQQLRAAYALLRKAVRQGGLQEAEADRKRDQERWERWEDEVERGQELAQEGDVVYWRPSRDDGWSTALVLAVQVLYEPSSGPHGWIYLQPLLPGKGDLFDADEDAEMEQVEPVSLDGVNWAFASHAEEIGGGAWKVSPPEYLPP